MPFSFVDFPMNAIESSFVIAAALVAFGSPVGAQKVCRKGKPCGDSCISIEKTCRTRAGTATMAPDTLSVAPAPQPPLARAVAKCGVERWPVKVLADKEASMVNRTPLDATVTELGALPVPAGPKPDDRRLPPHELQVYRVRAIIDQISTEDDSDWHLILRDPRNPRATMIAEIPAPECGPPELAALFTEARTQLRRIPRRGEAIVEGVAFFDFFHNQRGRAPNLIELHPVLRIGLPAK